MKARHGALVMLLLLSPLAAQDHDAACKVCHPGASKALAQSVHAPLLQQKDAMARACTVCHGEVPTHGSATATVAVPKVAAETCAVCHTGRALTTTSATHALLATGSGPLPPRPDAALQTSLANRTRAPGIDWSGFAELGYRFVHRTGSRAGYQSDVDLDSGVRLRNVELRGRGESAFADDLLLRGSDLGDPRWDAEAKLDQRDGYELDTRYRRDRFRYRADGEEHRVDRETAESRTDASVELGHGYRLFANYTHRDEDGFWLTQRIGNRNLPTQRFVDGVTSPRTIASDEGELGLDGTLAGWHGTFAASYLDERDASRWSYTQPAPADPTFDESEDFGSRSSLRGPSERLHLSRDVGPFAVDLTGRVVDHERRLAALGTGAGYDIAPFTTSSVAAGHGSSRTWLLDADVSLPLVADFRVLTDLHWRDHEERMQLAQTDVTVYPTLATSTSVQTDADQGTAQRLFDGAASLAWSPTTTFDASIGYGFAREQLRVPSLQPTDPLDFRRGHLADDGVLAALRWQPGAFTLRADLRDFGEDGLPLHELAPERARSVGGSVGWQRGGTHATVYARHRRSDNDVSRHHLEAFATGAQVGVTAGVWTCTGGYDFARSDSRTLTNFYFDPDPNPAPTFVGFRGDTHTVSGTLGASLLGDLHADVTAAWTKTTGSYDVDTFDWRADLRWQCTARGAAGVELRQLRYRDQGGVNDWDAAMAFVYWRQEF